MCSQNVKCFYCIHLSWIISYSVSMQLEVLDSCCEQVALDAGLQPNILLQIPAYAILTVSEILVSTTGLQFSYSQVHLSSPCLQQMPFIYSFHRSLHCTSILKSALHVERELLIRLQPSLPAIFCQQSAKDEECFMKAPLGRLGYEADVQKICCAGSTDT